MKIFLSLSRVVVSLMLFSACATSPTQPDPGPTGTHFQPITLEQGASEAKLLKGLGTYHRKISTQNPEAQTFFDQGLSLYYGFNHEEAFRSFARAAQLDPTCGICFWGASLSLGPNYNMPMLADRSAVAWQTRNSALEQAKKADPAEQALIQALSIRYSGPVLQDTAQQAKLNLAYANAMRKVAKDFPTDSDVQTLFAESMMDLNPWKLWLPDGRPAEGTPEIVTTLEGVLKSNPTHPGANHFYIHAVEASKTPEKALKSADRVGGMMKNAGHLVHMPSHIYQRVGQFEDAAEANRKAVKADQRYFHETSEGKPAGMYSMYAGHNYQFLAFSAFMEGSGAEAVSAAKKGAKFVDAHALTMMPGIEFFQAQAIVIAARIGQWKDVWSEPKPPAEWRVTTGLWHYSRGLGFFAKGETEKAKDELTQLKSVIAALPVDYAVSLNSAKDVLMIADHVLEGELLLASGNRQGIQHFKDAIQLEDGLIYDEPPNWWCPVRPLLGEAFLKLKEWKDAEQVFRKDLEIHIENGWSLHGLAKALRGQGMKAEASKVDGRFKKAWRHADRKL